ncbi:transport between ER and Golgi ATPase protein [Mucor velutinosus]|uniref:Transport between ER and Golgi ATPase protein n=1 Tax=Mucor velutinosus TaxID=708070 RepID=A0AAN7HLY9_9FUNG|nr:transport between ER and Golgi ATPase protein [Mucor velutinosus]
MSVTLGPTSSMITGSISSIISPTASSIISSTIPSAIESATSSINSPEITTATASSSTAATTSSSTAEETQSCTPGSVLDVCFDGSQYLDTALNTANIGSQFTICIVVGILLFMIFCIFRTRIPVLFSPRSNMKRHKPPELPTSLFGWIWPLIKISDEDMLTNVGLDALLMLKFVTMGIKIFAVCTVFGIIVFVPITMTSDYTHLGNATSPLDRLSISVIEQDSKKFIAYLVFAYFFTFVTFFFLNRNYNDYIYLRAKYLLKQSKSMVSRSVIVTGIPERLRSDQALADYYENLGVGSVESCYVVRTVHRLNTMIKKRAQALIKLEEAYAKYWGNPCRIPGYDPDRILDDVDMYKRVLDLAENRPDSSSDEEEEEDEENDAEKSEEGSSTLKIKKLKKKKKLGNTTFFKGLVEPMSLKKTTKSKRPLVRVGGFLGMGGKKVDAIEYYTKLFDDLDKTVMQRRSSPNFEMTNVAFVTFESMSSAIIASQIAINPEPFACRTSMACEPRDVLWSAISIRGRERIVREAIIWTITVVVCLFWFIPVGAISTLMSIPTIKKINPELGTRMENIPAVQTIFGTFIPPLVLNIFTSVLPLLFDTMGYYQGLRSRSAVAESTLSKQYFFLIFFTLIFYSVIGTSVMAILNMFATNPQGITKMLAEMLPRLAPFFINYTILQTFLIMPLNLLLLGAIIVRGFTHMFLCRTPREHAENRAPWSFNYGIGYPVPLLVFAIVFEYSLICPIILLFGTVYFCFTYVVYKYQFLYVYFRPYEVAGKLWTMVIPRVIFTLILFQLTMIGLFLLKGNYILSGLVVPLVLITILYRYLLSLAYSKNAHHLPMQLLKDNLQKLPTSDDEDSDEDDSSCDERIDEAKNQARMIEERKAEEEKKNEVRSRWKKAALSAVNLKPQQDAAAATKTDSKSTIIRPRHRKVVLDEDDYEATPDSLTDYRQPPMQLNPGLLDAGLKKYGNPLLVGYLPQLWLPVKMPAKGEEAKKPPVGRRKSDLLQNRHDGSGGNLAQHLAEILRKVERDNKAKEEAVAAAIATASKSRLEQEDALIAEARKTAHDDAASIVTGKTALPKINILRSMFKRGHIKKSNVKIEHTPAENFRLQHLRDQQNKADDTTLDQAERGAAIPDPQRQDSGGSGASAHDTDSVKSTARSVHQVYYHHPERRHSHAYNTNFLVPHHRVEMRHSGLSSPAIFPPTQTDDIEDTEEAGQNISRPDTQNSRLSSDPLIKKDTV